MPRGTRAEVALREHRAAVAEAARHADLARVADLPDDRSCYRVGCAAPGEVRFLDAGLRLTTACKPHGRDLWTDIGGSRAEGNGAFGWWDLSPANAADSGMVGA